MGVRVAISAANLHMGTWSMQDQLIVVIVLSLSQNYSLVPGLKIKDPV
jgi:hypothetical protein